LAGSDYGADMICWLMDSQGVKGYIDSEDGGY